MLKTFLKFDFRSREWWKIFGTYLFIYCFVIWLIMVTDHVLHSEAASGNISSVNPDDYEYIVMYHGLNDTYHILCSNTPLYFNVSTDQNVLLSCPAGSIQFHIDSYGNFVADPTVFTANTFRPGISFKAIKGDITFYNGSLVGLTYSSLFFDFPTINRNNNISSTSYIYLDAYDPYGRLRTYSISISLDDAGIKFREDQGHIFIDILASSNYYYYSGGNWYPVEAQPLVLKSILFSAAVWNRYSSQNITLNFDPHQIVDVVNPTMTPVPTLTPSPAPDPVDRTLPESSEFPVFNTYEDLINYFSQYDCDVFVSPLSGHLQVGTVVVGLNLSFPGWDNNVIFSGSRFYIFYFDYYENITSRIYKESYSSYSLKIYNPTYHDSSGVNFGRSFNHSIKSDWPFQEYVFATPTPIPSPTPSGPSPTPIISQIPFPTQLPYPTNIPPSQLLTDFPAPSGIPGYGDISIPGFNFDNEGFEQSFRGDKDKLTSIVNAADFSFFGLLSFLPEPVQLLLWLSLAGGIVAMIIRNIRR